MILTFVLIGLFVLVIGGLFAGYYSVRKAQMILDDSSTPSDQLFEREHLTPKEYGLRFGNGKSRIKKSNRLRLKYR